MCTAFGSPSFIRSATGSADGPCLQSDPGVKGLVEGIRPSRDRTVLGEAMSTTTPSIDILDFLADDHREAETLLNRFESIPKVERDPYFC
jgi:hypothetical protein